MKKKYMPNIQFNNALMKQRRIALGMTLADLAKRCETSKSYIFELERRGADPSGTKVFLLSRALGLSMEALYGFEKDGETYAAEIGAKVINALTGHLDLKRIAEAYQRKAV
jgi:transcriptional regulator with XRE-family HTH domain